MVISQNVEDENFLKKFKRGSAVLNAQVLDKAMLISIQKYLDRYTYVKLNSLQIYYDVIEDNFEYYSKYLNYKELKVLHLDNEPKIAEQFVHIKNLLHLRELTLQLSRLKRGFFKVNQFQFPPQLEKITLLDLDEERAEGLIDQIPLRLKHLSFKNCHFNDYDSLFQQLISRKITTLGFQNYFQIQTEQFFLACSKYPNAYKYLALEKVQILGRFVDFSSLFYVLKNTTRLAQDVETEIMLQLQYSLKDKDLIKFLMLMLIKAHKVSINSQDIQEATTFGLNQGQIDARFISWIDSVYVTIQDQT
ncbi:UNKNOWN [Stylonychia lemnae]|uniref:Uncharacterized protein n=1 Tax=Stylonychia lemnae TaxID=5949 RepID=A0A077ZXE1_STYLE|nr:UNKNOWN [Stylonychia lemnae]|eukprot:CDW74226.1 UNKNOWN [Stylonychia lemnae]